jgi:DNA-binding Lrp family transcriptional regulator
MDAQLKQALDIGRVEDRQAKIGKNELVARGTVQSRIARLERGGILRSYAPQIDTTALGFDVESFIQIRTAQGMIDEVSARLGDVPELVEAYSTTGSGDLLCRVAARDMHHLEQVVQTIVALPGVVRTETQLAMSRRVPYRIAPLLGTLSVDQREAR